MEEVVDVNNGIKIILCLNLIALLHGTALSQSIEGYKEANGFITVGYDYRKLLLDRPLLASLIEDNMFIVDISKVSPPLKKQMETVFKIKCGMRLGEVIEEMRKKIPVPSNIQAGLILQIIRRGEVKAYEMSPTGTAYNDIIPRPGEIVLIGNYGDWW